MENFEDIYDHTAIEVRENAEHLLQMQAYYARQDFNEFASFVLKDEITGEPVQQAPIHEKWDEIIGEHKRLLIWGHAESGKSQQIGIGRLLFELGHDTSLRCGLISNTGGTDGQASKLLRTTARYIDTSAELAMVFQDEDGQPKLRRSTNPSDPWTQKSITVERDGYIAHPSVRAWGAFGDILGSRLDLLIIDDILDWKNTLTAHRREALISWLRSSVMSRLTPRARVIMIGNAWHRDDAMHVFERDRSVWVAYRFPVINPQTGESSWPDHFPPERIEEKRQELGPLEFNRQMMCRPRSDEDSRFRDDWIRLSLSRGEGLGFARTLEDFPEGTSIVVSIDLASGKKGRTRKKGRSTAKTVFTVLGLLPDRMGTIRLGAIQGGRWTAPEILFKMVEWHERYGAVVVVEDTATQVYLLQMAAELVGDDGQKLRLPLVSHQTDTNKWDPVLGVEAIAADMARNRFIFPNAGFKHSGVESEDGFAPAGEFPDMHPELQSLIADMQFFHPDAHTGDYLMSFWIGWLYLSNLKPFDRQITSIAGDLESEAPTPGVVRVKQATNATEGAMEKAQVKLLWDALGFVTGKESKDDE